MPEICRFYGIVIRMFFDDHNPPHFYAQYAGQGAVVDIKTFVVISGELAPQAHGLVVEWASLHREELLARMIHEGMRRVRGTAAGPRRYAQNDLLFDSTHCSGRGIGAEVKARRGGDLMERVTDEPQRRDRRRDPTRTARHHELFGLELWERAKNLEPLSKVDPLP